MGEFDAVLGERPNQVDRRRDDVDVGERDLLDVASTPGDITDDGLRANVSVGVAYIDSWLNGNGAAAINGLMEDAATAEISRSQVWQWLRHERVGRAAVRQALDDEPAGPARDLFERVALSGRDDFVEFLTLPAYDLLED
jgi:malate synthase